MAEGNGNSISVQKNNLLFFLHGKYNFMKIHEEIIEILRR